MAFFLFNNCNLSYYNSNHADNGEVACNHNVGKSIIIIVKFFHD